MGKLTWLEPGRHTDCLAEDESARSENSERGANGEAACGLDERRWWQRGPGRREMVQVKDSWEIELAGIGDWLGKQEQVRRVRLGQLWRLAKRKKTTIPFPIKLKFNFCHLGFPTGLPNPTHMTAQPEVLGWHCIDPQSRCSLTRASRSSTHCPHPCHLSFTHPSVPPSIPPSC